MNLARTRWKRRKAVDLHGREFLLDLLDDGRQGRAAVAGLELHSIPAIRIVAGGDHYAARRGALAHQQRNCRRGARRSREPNGNAGHGNRFSDSLSEALRAKAVVVSDDHSLIWFLGAYQITGDGPGDLANMFKTEIVGNDAAPTICAKANRIHGRKSICERATQTKRGN